MIKDILTILKSSDFYNRSEVIEIAKGRYALPLTWKGFVKNIKRQIKWRLKK